MMLYWGFWTLIQVGSLIAIVGIMINLWYSLGEKENPPWIVALGTPVLVIAALGHAWQNCVRTAWRRWTGKAEKTRMWNVDEASMQRVYVVHSWRLFSSLLYFLMWCTSPVCGGALLYPNS
jgi:hypothetical protein